MKRLTVTSGVIPLLGLLLLGAGPLPKPAESDRLAGVAERAVRAVQAGHPDVGMKDDQVAVTVVDLSRAGTAEWGSYRGREPIYPASVVKLFYLAHAHQLIEEGKLADTPELRRGLREMIVESDNDATAYILYAITDAPNGAELPEEEMKAWAHKRFAVNRFFEGLGYPKINACQCAYSFGPFGRERIFLGEKLTNRNMLSTDATALLMYHIASGQMVSEKASGEMMALLKRDRAATRPSGGDDQTFGFTGGGLPEGWKLWSKAGWTSTARHDAAYVESPDGGRKMVIVVYTTGLARKREIIPGIVRSVLEQTGSK